MLLKKKHLKESIENDKQSIYLDKKGKKSYYRIRVVSPLQKQESVKFLHQNKIK